MKMMDTFCCIVHTYRTAEPGLGPKASGAWGRILADPLLRGIIRLHTGVPLGSKVAKYGGLECGTMPNRSSLNHVSVPIYRTIVR